MLNQSEHMTGNITESPGGSDSTAAGPARPREEPLKVTVKRRLEREGRWPDIEPTRDAMMREARAKGMSKQDAQAWTYAELDRLYPPIPQEVAADVEAQADQGAGQGAGEEESAKPAAADQQEGEGVSASADGGSNDAGDTELIGPARPREAFRLPTSWPVLPANASLAAEIAWVQSNRLAVVEERLGRPAIVRLDRAHEPAPSRAALGWLETSIRSYAKYVEVAAKVTSTAEDEQQLVRHERMRIEEIRALLDEMLRDKD
jgi:hypothetical protein